jgi:hypothetical protein
MQHSDIVNSIKHIRPNAQFSLTGDELQWFDTEQTEPTAKEIEAGLKSYKLAIKQEAESKAVQRQAIADRLGLTADELKLLFG